jgi:signal transduction histidine kinase
VTSLNHLLNDVTSLARLQAGRETRQIDAIDVTAILMPLCEDIRPLAEQRGLYLKCAGPEGFAVDGDAVKIRRIAQNLILNAVKYTRNGGVNVNWGDSEASDFKRWCLTIADTGPGFHTASGQPIAAALDPAHEPSLPAKTTVAQASSAQKAASTAKSQATRSIRGEAGEGIGLSIVKRLCEMLDATIEMESVKDQGSTFRILFPRHYSS